MWASSILLLLLVTASDAVILSVTSGTNWCTVANGASAGDVVVLESGTHSDACQLSAAGTSWAVNVTIRGAPGSTMTYSGCGSNMIDINSPSKFLVLEDLNFPTSCTGVFGIRVKGGVSDVIMQRLVFADSGMAFGGSAITANSNGDTDRITVRNCVFGAIPYTALYFGCPTGTCQSRDYLIEDNLWKGNSATYVIGQSDGTGYGFQAKECSYGTIRNNVFLCKSKGPNWAVYGGPASSCGGVQQPVTIVEGNYASGGTTNDGPIWAGGGPVKIRNNLITAGGSQGSFYTQVRTQQIEVEVEYNTFLNDFTLSGWNAVGQNNVFSNNAIVGTLGTITASEVSGNTECANIAACFDPATYKPSGMAIPDITCDMTTPANDFSLACRVCPSAGGALDRSPTALTFPAWPNKPVRNSECGGATPGPTKTPTKTPTSKSPTKAPSTTKSPSKAPTTTKSPTNSPTVASQGSPTPAPTNFPTTSSSEAPSKSPTRSPTIPQDNSPTGAPSAGPTASGKTSVPTLTPTVAGAVTPKPTTGQPSPAPSPAPSVSPTVARGQPSKAPTTRQPSSAGPTVAPTTTSSAAPSSASPSASPTQPPTTATANLGAIVGGAIGGVAAIAAAIVVGVLCYRKQSLSNQLGTVNNSGWHADL